MRQYEAWLAGTMLVGAISLTACEGPTGQAQPESTPQKLSNAPPQEPINAPDIDMAMQLYNANIGDTATGVGGGGAGGH
ncbi:MAG: hypothetical protein ACM359_12665 [Bacillota bacterium]